jgi:hypothetical protein
MAKIDRDEQQQDPEDLVIRAFSRCQNYPKDRLGVLGLAQGLKLASDRFSVKMEEIINECVESSVFCPTDADLLNVARELVPKEKSVEEKWKNRKCPFQLCDGSGWREKYYLHTHHVGDGDRAAWVEKVEITQEQYDVLSVKVDWKTQMAYAGRYRCKCHPPREPEPEKPKRKRLTA